MQHCVAKLLKEKLIIHYLAHSVAQNREFEQLVDRGPCFTVYSEHTVYEFDQIGRKTTCIQWLILA